jgi:hypothetical protein
MDPNVTLLLLRLLIVDMQAATDDGRGIDPDDVEEMVELVDSLDCWISIGGFLPTAWEKALETV